MQTAAPALLLVGISFSVALNADCRSGFAASGYFLLCGFKCRLALRLCCRWVFCGTGRRAGERERHCVSVGGSTLVPCLLDDDWDIPRDLHPDTTSVLDWALKVKYLLVYPRGLAALFPHESPVSWKLQVLGMVDCRCWGWLTAGVGGG